MIVLLLASSVAAALVPIPDSADQDSTTTTATEATASADALERTLRADAEKPGTIRVHAGDQLALEVVGNGYDLVEIPALGQVEDVNRGSPARFNLLLEQPGSYAVRLAGTGLIGRIEVTQGRNKPDHRSKPSEPGERNQPSEPPEAADALVS